MSTSAFRNYTNRILHRGIQKHYCISLLHFSWLSYVLCSEWSLDERWRRGELYVYDVWVYVSDYLRNGFRHDHLPVCDRNRTWHKNNQSPRLSVNATIVAKRESITHHSHANAGDLSGTHGYHSTSSTSYYVTFQVESGDRMELPVSGREYGMLAEGDIGKLTFQGTRYLSFERVWFGRW